jgi:hypothetical protein
MPAYHPPVSGPISDYDDERRGRSPTLESQLRGADPGVPFIPTLPSQASRRAGVPEGAPEGAPSAEGPRSLEGAPYGAPPGAPYARSGTVSDVIPIPEPQTRGHITGTPPYQDPYGVPRSQDPYGVPRSQTPPYSDDEPRDGSIPRGASPGASIPRGATPGVSRVPTSRTAPRTVRRYPSGPGALDYDDAEQARQERFGEIERQFADITLDAAEAEQLRDRDFRDREMDRERHFGENEARREADARHLIDEMSSALGQGPFAGVPPLPGTEIPETEGALPVPGPMFGVPTPSALGVPEQAESVIATIRRASSESAARHADDIRDIVQGEREEMAKQLQLERDEARAAHEAMEQQLLAERARADEDCRERIRELQDELARVRAELDHEKQQRINDEELRREEDARKEGDDDMRQQLSEITDLLLAHREEFARKKEIVDEHWERKQEWRDEDGRRWDELYRMVQGLIEDHAEDRERCEEERRAAAERPSK